MVSFAEHGIETADAQISNAQLRQINSRIGRGKFIRDFVLHLRKLRTLSVASIGEMARNMMEASDILCPGHE
jgi:hypothetical protein